MGARTRRWVPSASQGLSGSAQAGPRTIWAGLGHPGMEWRGSAQEIPHLPLAEPGCTAHWVLPGVQRGRDNPKLLDSASATLAAHEPGLCSALG